MDRLKLLTLATALLGVTSLELALLGAHVVTRRLARRLARAGVGPAGADPVVPTGVNRRREAA